MYVDTIWKIIMKDITAILVLFYFIFILYACYETKTEETIMSHFHSAKTREVQRYGHFY